jgi:tetratricopeptide (TPR) repeat protein
MATQGAAGASGAEIAEIARLADQDRPAATELASKAKSRGLQSPLIHFLIGSELEDARRYDAAVAEFGQGLMLAPHDPRLISSVGRCLMKLGRAEEALKVFAAALNADPTSADASFGYGWAAASLGATESAESAFQRAVDLNPVHADALAGLAGLALEQGDWVRTRSMASESLVARPGNLDAVMTLARLEINQEVFDSAETRLRTVLETPDLDSMARADVLIHLGDALDGQGRHGEALDQYLAGKAERARARGGANGTSAPESVQKIAAAFQQSGADWSNSEAGSGPDTGFKHLILAGFPGAGVEAAGALMTLFPGVSVLDRTPLLTKADNAFLDPPDGMARLARANSHDLQAFRTDYLARARQFGAKEAVLVDVQPLATIRLPILAKLFPAAAVAFITRDPRNVVWDCFRHDRSDGPVGRSFDTISGTAEFFDAVMTATETYFADLDIVPIRIAAEDFGTDLAKVLRQLSKSLDLAEPPITFRQAQTLLDRRPTLAAAGHWRNYAGTLEVVRKWLDPWVEKLGCEPW